MIKCSDYFWFLSNVGKLLKKLLKSFQWIESFENVQMDAVVKK